MNEKTAALHDIATHLARLADAEEALLAMWEESLELQREANEANDRLNAIWTEDHEWRRADREKRIRDEAIRVEGTLRDLRAMGVEVRLPETGNIAEDLSEFEKYWKKEG